MTSDGAPSDPLYPALRAHEERQTSYARWISAALGASLALVVTTAGAGIFTSLGDKDLSSGAGVALIGAAFFLAAGILMVLAAALSTVNPVIVDLESIARFVERHPDIAERSVPNAQSLIATYVAAQERMRKEAEAFFADSALRPFHGYLDRAVQHLSFIASDLRLLATRAAAAELELRWKYLRARLLSGTALCIAGSALAVVGFVAAPSTGDDHAKKPSARGFPDQRPVQADRAEAPNPVVITPVR